MCVSMLSNFSANSSLITTPWQNFYSFMVITVFLFQSLRNLERVLVLFAILNLV